MEWSESGARRDASAPGAGFDFFAPSPAPSSTPGSGAPQAPAYPFGAPNPRFGVPDPRLASAAPPLGPPVAAPAPFTPGPVVHPGSAGESGLRVGVALAATALALVLSVVLHYVAPQVIHVGDVIDTSLRRALGLTALFYVVVGALTAVFVVKTRTRLVWHRGSVPGALLLGAPLGLLGGLLAVAINSAIFGHLTGDPNAEALVGGGGWLRLGLTFVVLCLMAPLVEETIFRGICAGTLLGRSTAAALWVSAGAFAIWHLNPAELRYYALMGLILAGIWLKRGLIASMSAHACFNGVLTAAAIMATTGAGTPLTLGQVSLQVPGGWHPVTPQIASAQPAPYQQAIVAGPSGAVLSITDTPAPALGVTTADVETQLRSNLGLPGLLVDPGSIESATLPIGSAVLADVTIDGQPGHIVVFSYNANLYDVLMLTSGSPAAESEWPDVVDSITPA